MNRNLLLRVLTALAIAICLPSLADEGSIANWISPGNQSAITDDVFPKGSKIKIEVLDTSGKTPQIEVWRDRNPSMIYPKFGGLWTPKKGEKITVEMPANAKAMIQGHMPTDLCAVSIAEKDGAHRIRMVKQLGERGFVLFRVTVTK